MVVECAGCIMVPVGSHVTQRGTPLPSGGQHEKLLSCKEKNNSEKIQPLHIHHLRFSTGNEETDILVALMCRFISNKINTAVDCTVECDVAATLMLKNAG